MHMKGYITRICQNTITNTVLECSICNKKEAGGFELVLLNSRDLSLVLVHYNVYYKHIQK